MKKITNTKEQAVQLAEEVKNYLTKMFDAFKQTVEIKVEVEDFSGGDYQIHVNVGNIYLIYINFREKTIESLTGTEMVEDYLFDIVGIKYNPGVYMYPDGSGEPPSEDEVDICTKESTLAAAGEVVGLYADMVINDIIQGIEEDKMLREQEEYHKQLAEDEESQST
jgi:hypothetical protein